MQKLLARFGLVRGRVARPEGMCRRLARSFSGTYGRRLKLRTEKEIRAKLKEIESDERLSYKPATLEVNAPLALIQLEGHTKINVLEWVLEDGGE